MTRSLFFLILVLSTGCARLKYALRKEASSPHVWAPLALAGALRVNHNDKRISRWARTETPIFDDRKNADRWSDGFSNVAEIEAYASLIAEPGLGRGTDWGNYAKTKGVQLLAMEGGVRSTYWATQGAKSTFQRQRPSKQDHYSFPSGHGSAAAAWRKATEQNLDRFNVPYPIIGGINQALAIGTLWGRVEAGKHYPTDVLVGYALGTFLTGVVWSAVYGEEGRETGSVGVTPMKGGGGLAYYLLF